jgi:lipoprotein-anchoring transpeptidase ErfK/SrfK
MHYLKVIISEQKMYLYEGNELINTYEVSTSRFGIGNKKNSFKTPLGRHRIIEKIGADVPEGGIFKQKKFSGQTFHGKKEHNNDLITTRILILEGMEPGKNSGDGIDSKDRGIWIHGTHEEEKIGTPASHGCIRLKNSDVIDLYERIKTGSVVEIEE